VNMEPVAMEDQEHVFFHGVETSSGLDAMVSECNMSSSQEEMLMKIPEWPRSPPQSHMPCSPSQQEFASQDASVHALLNPTVGARITEFCSPLETSCPWEEDGEDNSQTGFGIDSFDPRFESDRDQSPATQTDSVVMMRGIGLDSNQLTAGIQTPDKSLLQLQEVSSANLSNNANATAPCSSKITPKTATCRRILVDDESQPETTLDKSPLNLAPDKSTSASQPLTQSDAIMDTQWLSRGAPDKSTSASQPVTQSDAIMDTQWLSRGVPDKSTSASQPLTQSDAIMDTQWLSRGDLLNSQLLTNVAQISGRLLPTAKSVQGLDIQASPAAKLAEDQGEAIEIEGSRAHRILPPSLAGSSVQRNTMTSVEIERDPEQLKDALSKKRRRNPRPVPETLMDVIMHYSGDPPIGFEDVDIVQVAIKAGMTFPPPICRHSFPG